MSLPGPVPFSVFKGIFSLADMPSSLLSAVLEAQWGRHGYLWESPGIVQLIQ